MVDDSMILDEETDAVDRKTNEKSDVLAVSIWAEVGRVRQERNGR